jgi:hypothetical protein
MYIGRVMNFLRYEKQVQLNRLDKWPSSRVIAHYLYDKSGFKPLSRKKFIKGYLRYYAGKSQGE